MSRKLISTDEEFDAALIKLMNQLPGCKPLIREFRQAMKECSK